MSVTQQQRSGKWFMSNKRVRKGLCRTKKEKKARSRADLAAFIFQLRLWSMLLMRELCLLLCTATFVGCLLLPGQKDSLVALYNSTGGPFWSLKQWDISTDPCNPSPWAGVSCDGSASNVLRINLPNNNLTGSLPDLRLPELEGL